jgi:hypothetical protein
MKKRKFLRFDVPLFLKFKPSKDSTKFCFGLTRNFSREGVCFDSEYFESNPDDTIELRIEVPEQNMYVSAFGKVVWTKRVGERCISGVKIVAMDKEGKSEILDYAYNLWLNEMRRKIKENKSVKSCYTSHKGYIF